MKKTIIVSAVNLVEGGSLAVLQECLRYLSSDLSDKYEIIALVNRKELFVFGNIKYLEFPEADESWIKRLYYEYYYFSRLAKQLNPFLWLSLHDITPNVRVDRLAVYCHNASPFYSLSFKEATIDLRFTLFKFFYKYLYAINIKKADFVIVQQEWLRQSFLRLYQTKSIIVAHPQSDNTQYQDKKNCKRDKNSNFVFFYPSLPRVFKNFEIICRASKILLQQGISNFEVIFTISGSENRYAKNIYHAFKHLKNIKFIGIQDRNRIDELYSQVNCIIFPSKLESWGLPITEFKKYHKPILLADLPYAHETLGRYDQAMFFHPDNHEQLADAMKALMNGAAIFENIEPGIIRAPFSQNWKELFDILLSAS